MEENDALLEQLELYLTGQMSEEEHRQFEQEIESNPDLQEFLVIYESVDAFQDEDNWPEVTVDSNEVKAIAEKFRASDTLEFEEKVKQFHQQRTQKSSFGRRGLIVMTSIAAACLLFIFQLWPPDITLDSVYEDNSSWSELPSFSEKSDTTNAQKLRLEAAFKAAQYEQVIAISDSILSNIQPLAPNVMIYQGISLLELNRFDDAIAIFTKLSNSNALDAHKAYWYIALVHAKQGNFDQFSKAIKKVESDSTYYKHKEAVLILKQFE